MGTGLEMKFKLHALVGIALCAALLSACGNDIVAGEAREAMKQAKDLAARGFGSGHGSAGTPASTVSLANVRAALGSSGQPVYRIAIETVGYIDFMAPYGNNGPIRTWASNTYETVSLNDGVLTATRGFGPDLMTSVAPGLGQVSAANGFFHRVYYYLDGADQTQRIDFDCNFSSSGSETVTVLDLTYVARRVNESCANPDHSFQNVYWFDGSGKLRQSEQFVSYELGSMHLQRVID